MFCCLRPANDEDPDVLATVAVSAPSQGRGRIAPSPPYTQPLDSSRGRGSTQKQQGRAIQQPYSSDASRPTACSLTQTPAAGGGSGSPGRPNGLLSWAMGGGKASAAEYRDTDPLDRLGGKGLLMSFLSRAGSGMGSGSGSGSGSSFRPDAATGAATKRGTSSDSSRRKLTFAGGRGGSDDGDDEEQDDDVAAEPSVGGTVGRIASKDAVRAHLKTQQPKRGILKKADTPLDAAAGGDEEALLRVATALAAANSAVSGALALASATATSPFQTAWMSGAALGSQTSMRRPDATAGAQAAAGGLSLSPGQVSLDGLGPGGGGPTGRIGSGSGGAAAASSIGGATAAAVAAVAASGSASANPSVRFSGAAGTPAPSVVIGVPLSLLANSSTGGWLAAGPGPDTPAVSTAGAAGAAPSRSYSVRSAAVLSFRGNSLSRGSFGGLSSQVVVFGPREAASGPVEPDGTAGPPTGFSGLTATSPELTTPGQPPPSQPLRRQLSERPLTPSSHITPVVPATFMAETYGAPDGGAGGSRPRSPAAAAAFVAKTASLSGSQDINLAASRNGRGRRAQLTAARREEILRSLPSGKSPIWYAHKLREILGTNEVDEEEALAGVDGGGSDGAAAAGARSSPLEDFVEDAEAGSAAVGDGSISRRIATSRSLRAGGVPSDTGPRLGLSTPPGEPSQYQRCNSRLQCSTYQSTVSVRHLAAAAARAGAGGTTAAARGLEESLWTSGSHASLPGSMVLCDTAGDGGGGGGGFVANSEPVRIVRQNTSQRRVTYDTGDGTAMQQALLQRLADGYASNGNLGAAAAAAGSGGDVVTRGPSRAPSGVALSGVGNGCCQSDPLSKLRSGSGGFGKALEAGRGAAVDAGPIVRPAAAVMAAPSLLRPPSFQSRTSGVWPSAGGSVGASGGGHRGNRGSFRPVAAEGFGAGAAATTSTVGGGGGVGAAGAAGPRPQADAPVQSGGEKVDTAAASPVWVLEEASKKLAGLLQQFGTDGVIYEGDEDEEDEE